MKTCSKCKADKPLSEFYNDKHQKNGKTCRCKVCIDIADKKWREANREKVAAKMRCWRAANPGKRALAWKRHQKTRRQKLSNRINDSISASIHKALKRNKNGRPWQSLVGYSLKDLIKHLKTTLPEGYTWEEFKNGADLHIDHIVPVSVFNFSKPEHIDFKRCWALKNLQLLPAKENRKKQDKLDRPFQPCLAF